MVNHSIAAIISKNLLTLFCAAGIAVSPGNISKELPIPKELLMPISQSVKVESLAESKLWIYLRAGINYLEASGKEVPIDYKHPGGKAYGPLALTEIAIKDVKLHYPILSGYKLDEVLSDKGVYEKFAVAYAELLLKHYFKLDYLNMPKEQVFDVLQRGWFLGPTLYRKGRNVIAVRQKHADEYIDSPTIII